MCTTSAVFLSMRMFCKCRSPRPNMCPTMDEAATLYKFNKFNIKTIYIKVLIWLIKS